MHQRVTYEDVLRENASHLTALVAAGDIVLLHDPQTAGLVAHLQALGATVVWRCHIGTDESNSEVEYGWRFLEPYLQDVSATVFTRRQYVPACCDSGRAVIIPPSIEPFSAKNQEMDADTVRSILAHTGLLELPGTLRPVFSRKDGSPGGVDRRADIVRVGSAPTWDTPLIAQISRWDPLKDHLGVMEGFVRLLERPGSSRAHLVLAGPTVSGVADDPEVGATLDEIIKRWHGLPHGYRRKVHVACLPMDDSDENAAIVNALQRHATIVVQKSLGEGFGLTVTEAMWKARPLVASAVGGIKDQIVSGVHGRLISDPRNLDEFADALELLLAKEDYAKTLGKNAQARVREEYLPTRHLMQYAELLQRIGI